MDGTLYLKELGLRTTGGGPSVYFDELLQRIRDIRLGEASSIRRCTDLYATSVDYDSRRTTSGQATFFATVQNKLHWAVHGKTAAEVIVAAVPMRGKPNMGLTLMGRTGVRWASQKFDVVFAKNYLTESRRTGRN
jgi:hypothetical protein